MIINTQYKLGPYILTEIAFFIINAGLMFSVFMVEIKAESFRTVYRGQNGIMRKHTVNIETALVVWSDDISVTYTNL